MDLGGSWQELTRFPTEILSSQVFGLTVKSLQTSSQSPSQWSRQPFQSRARLCSEPSCTHFMRSTVEAPSLVAAPSPTEEERRALVQRIVASTPFRKSARLRDFLLYVAAASLRDAHAELTEQEIGEKVFGRPVSYNRSQDNIVRVNATELRRRIDHYFAEEGIKEEIVLEIPRGGYKPIFHQRANTAIPLVKAAVVSPPPALVAVAEMPVPPLSAPRAPEWHSGWQYWVWAFVTAALMILSGALWRQDRLLQGSALDAAPGPALKSFWNSFAGNHQPVDIVLPDDSASVVEDITRESISLPAYLRGEYMKDIKATNLSSDRKMDLAQISSHNLITFGDMEAAHLVAQYVPTEPAPQFTLARYYTTDAMKRDNLIFIGGSKANPWVRLLEDRMNFVVDYDFAEGHAVVLNKHPLPGEQTRYVPPSSTNEQSVYSVVTYLPNPSQHGQAVVVAGMDADSTSAAAEFLTSEVQMQHFRELLKVRNFPYFEVLLRVSRVKGTPFNSKIVAYRTYYDLN